MTYPEVLANARECIGKYCKALPGVQRRGLQKPDPRPRCQGRGRYGHPQL